MTFNVVGKDAPGDSQIAGAAALGGPQHTSQDHAKGLSQNVNRFVILRDNVTKDLSFQSFC